MVGSEQTRPVSVDVTRDLSSVSQILEPKPNGGVTRLSRSQAVKTQSTTQVLQWVRPHLSLTQGDELADFVIVKLKSIVQITNPKDEVVLERGWERPTPS